MADIFKRIFARKKFNSDTAASKSSCDKDKDTDSGDTSFFDPANNNIAEGNVLVIGPPDVGKKALLVRLAHDGFTENYDPTGEQSYRTVHKLTDGTGILLNMLALSFSGGFTALVKHCLDTHDLYLLVYQVDDPSTFEATKEMYEQHIASRPPPTSGIHVVGTCTDLVSGSATGAVQSGQSFAAARGFRHSLVSAKTGDGCDDLKAHLAATIARAKFGT